MVFVRPEAHEIDTLARRQVPMTLPVNWEHRETTGRDYGIDMMVEIFEKGKATGNSLLFQIKGTSKTLSPSDDGLIFDFPVSTLKYSELFIVPMLLTFCPVHQEPPDFYYLWLQEYVRVVLNYENPDWRNNSTTVRLHIPKENQMSGKKKELEFIAGFPQRLFGISNFARILDLINALLDGEPTREQYQQVGELLGEISGLSSIFDSKWVLANWLKDTYLIPAMRAVELLIQDGPISTLDIQGLPMYENPAKLLAVDLINTKFLVECQVKHSLRALTQLLEETNYSMKNFMWTETQAHFF